MIVSILNLDQELTAMSLEAFHGWPDALDIRKESAGSIDLYESIHHRRINYSDFTIALDEDCFIFNRDELMDTIDYMRKYGYDYAGMPEIGVSSHRFGGKQYTNSFFMLFNGPLIYQKGITGENTYWENPPKPREDYWRVFRAMDSEGAKRLGLKGRDHPTDPITTVLEGINGKDMLYHTWFAREYISPRHNERIKARYQEAKELWSK